MRNIIGSVEIGTSHAKALVGEIGENENVQVLGMGFRPNEGMRKGEINNFPQVAESVHAAIDEAEKMSGTTVDSIYLAQSGSHLKGRMLQGSSYVSSSDNRVSQEDKERAEKEAQLREAEEGRKYVHFVQTPILLDGQVREDPVGMVGKKLDLGFWAIDGEEQAMQTSLHVIRNYNIDVADLIVSSIASATLVAGPDLRKAGTLVIDLGAGVTDFVLYRHGFVASSGVVPVGGDHITGDLSMGLRILERYAEKLKIEHGKATPDQGDEKEDVWMVGDRTIGDRSVPRKAIADIIHVRVVELFEIICKELGELLDPDELKGGVLLTGGASRLPGIEQVASKVLGLPVRKASFHPGIVPELAQPEYSTVLGLLHYGLKDHNSPRNKHNSEKSGLIRKLGELVGINP